MCPRAAVLLCPDREPAAVCVPAIRREEAEAADPLPAWIFVGSAADRTAEAAREAGFEGGVGHAGSLSHEIRAHAPLRDASRSTAARSASSWSGFARSG